MKLFRKKYKPFPTPENTPGYTNKKVFDNFITEASKILQDTRRSQTVDKTSIFVLLKHLTDLVTLETSFTAYDHSSTEFSDYLLQIFEVRNEHNAKKLFEEIYLNLEANYKFNPNKPGIFQWQSVDDVFLMVVD